jgi:hypothetical protein
MVPWRFSQALSVVALVALSGSLVAQDSDHPPAPPAPATTQSAKPALPDAPIPDSSSSPSQSSGTAKPDSSFSASSSSSSSGPDASPKFWTSNDPNAQVTVLENTLFRVMTNDPLSTRETRKDAPLLFILSEDVVVDGVLIIPAGATVHGTVVESKQAGTFTGRPELILKLTSLDLGGRSYPLYSYQFTVEGTSKTRPTENKILGGAVIGAVVGGVLSESAKGATTAAGKLAEIGTGSAIGAGAGTAVAAATPGPILTIPAESQFDFILASPISVVPVTPEEAKRLSQGLHPGGPVLYVRGQNQ